MSNYNRGYFSNFSLMRPFSSGSDSEEEDRQPADLMPKQARQREDAEENQIKQQKLMDALAGKEDFNGPALIQPESLLCPNDDGAAQAAAQAACEECLDQPAKLFCEDCEEQSCKVCWDSLHRRGKRKSHKTRLLHPDEEIPSAQASVPAEEEKNNKINEEMENSQETTGAPNAHSLTSLSSHRPFSPAWFVERSHYIPLRLTLPERKSLRLAESALFVSEYSDKVDVVGLSDRKKRILEQIRDVCAILSGLVVASDYKLGQQLIAEKEFSDNEQFFSRVFEIARRHKIRNPEKMRDSYGKMMLLLQDSQQPEINDLLGFSLVTPIRTVYSVLEENRALAMLEDPRLILATSEIIATNKSRPQIDLEIRRKNEAIKALGREYSNASINEEEIQAAIYSIGDNHTYLVQSRNLCDELLSYLTENFHPETIENPYSLAIIGGRGGARLTHSHAHQYQYVQQSLYLWREILNEMFYLWSLSEQDLLDSQNSYRLRNTGQGLNRVQSCPRVGRAMQNILYSCQKKLGHWIGSSVIHLGDSNVPNSLAFLDKYNQVSRILTPICQTLRAIPKLYEKPDTKLYIDRVFGGCQELRMMILTDFFRSAFDGSGADDYFSAGSCIDGRLTSAWNWCSLIEKKPFYHFFLLTGFTGFDGQF